jgi:hypothetical protein
MTEDPETINNSVYSLMYHHKDRAAAKEQHSTLISVVTCRCYQIGHAIKISHRCFTANIASSIERFFFRGDLVFVTKGKICVPKQRAGSTQGNDIAHGVTTLRFGVRYSLFLLLQQNKTCWDCSRRVWWAVNRRAGQTNRKTMGPILNNTVYDVYM